MIHHFRNHQVGRIGRDPDHERCIIQRRPLTGSRANARPHLHRIRQCNRSTMDPRSSQDLAPRQARIAAIKGIVDRPLYVARFANDERNSGPYDPALLAEVGWRKELPINPGRSGGQIRLHRLQTTIPIIDRQSLRSHQGGRNLSGLPIDNGNHVVVSQRPSAQLVPPIDVLLHVIGIIEEPRVPQTIRAKEQGRCRRVPEGTIIEVPHRPHVDLAHSRRNPREHGKQHPVALLGQVQQMEVVNEVARVEIVPVARRGIPPARLVVEHTFKPSKPRFNRTALQSIDPIAVGVLKVDEGVVLARNIIAASSYVGRSLLVTIGTGGVEELR